MLKGPMRKQKDLHDCVCIKQTLPQTLWFFEILSLALPSTCAKYTPFWDDRSKSLLCHWFSLSSLTTSKKEIHCPKKFRSTSLNNQTCGQHSLKQPWYSGWLTWDVFCLFWDVLKICGWSLWTPIISQSQTQDIWTGLPKSEAFENQKPLLKIQANTQIYYKTWQRHEKLSESPVRTLSVCFWKTRNFLGLSPGKGGRWNHTETPLSRRSKDYLLQLKHRQMEYFTQPHTAIQDRAWNRTQEPHQFPNLTTKQSLPLQTVNILNCSQHC